MGGPHRIKRLHGGSDEDPEESKSGSDEDSDSGLCYATKEERDRWGTGTHVQVFSASCRNWYEGIIDSITHYTAGDDIGEWLDVSFGNEYSLCKQVRRLGKEIRPSPLEESNASSNEDSDAGLDVGDRVQFTRLTRDGTEEKIEGKIDGKNENWRRVTWGEDQSQWVYVKRICPLESRGISLCRRKSLRKRDKHEWYKSPNYMKSRQEFKKSLKRSRIQEGEEPEDDEESTLEVEKEFDRLLEERRFNRLRGEFEEPKRRRRRLI